MIIDEEKKVTHSCLMEDTETIILNPGMAKVKLKAENVDVCYAPVFQSGKFVQGSMIFAVEPHRACFLETLSIKKQVSSV